MLDNDKSWPSEAFRPVFHYVLSKHPKLTARRAAEIAKGILAAQEALNFSMSRNRLEDTSDVLPMESSLDTEQRN